MGMREAIRDAQENKPQGYLSGIVNKTHRNVDIIEGINHSDMCLLGGGARDYKETTLFWQ